MVRRCLLKPELFAAREKVAVRAGRHWRRFQSREFGIQDLAAERYNILFKPGSDRLTDSSYISLDQLASLLLAHAEWHLTIEGYTDNSGTQAKNLLLSRKRAAAVKDYLEKKGVAEAHLEAAGYGQASPIADNGTPQGKAANRRVELKLALEKSQF